MFQQLTLDEALSVTVTKVAPPLQPVSKDLIEQNRKDVHVKHCPTCHHEERVYRRTLRPCFIPALRALLEYGPMTTTELFKYFEDRPGVAAAIARHFSEVRHWKFAVQDEDDRWHLSLRAEQFLRGEIQVMRKVWPRDVELPEECRDEELIWVHDVKAEEFSDKGKHLEESVSLPARED